MNGKCLKLRILVMPLLLLSNYSIALSWDLIHHMVSFMTKDILTFLPLLISWDAVRSEVSVTRITYHVLLGSCKRLETEKTEKAENTENSRVMI